MTDIKQCDSCGKLDVMPYFGADLVMKRYITTLADKPYEEWYLCRKCATKKLDRIEQIIREEEKE